MYVIFILVEPSVPQNIGACARAMNTMGFEALRLVNPRCDHLDERSRWMAHGSADILKSARVFPTLADALADVDFSIGTTARKRHSRRTIVPARALRQMFGAKAGLASTAALVFGPEDHGLSNRDLDLCDCVSTVPLAAKHPSLNLAQAAMIYAYELSPLHLDTAAAPERDHRQYAALRKRVSSLLEAVGMAGDSIIHRRILDRLAHASAADIRLIHSVAEKASKKIR